MSKRLEYGKRLMKKAIVIYTNLGLNEREEMDIYMDDMYVGKEETAFLLNDAESCKCKDRKDVLEINDKKYCMDCLHYIEVNNIAE